MFKQDSKFVKHIFWDPEMKTCYSLYVTIENQQKIQNDKVFALKTFQQAKSVFLQNEAAKLKKETNLQSKQDEQENSSTNDVNKKRIKKENDDPDEADDNNATNKKLKKETTPIKGEVISDNEVDDEKLNENKIIEMLDNDNDGDGDDNNDNKNKNNDDESSNKVTKKKVKEEEINVPEFVNVQQDESIIPDNNDEWHDASSQQEDNTVNNFEDVSDDNNAKKTNTASRRLTRNRKISNQKPVQRPRRLVTMEKPKIEQFSWNHNDIKFLIKSYERHQELLKNQVKNRFFWTNIVKDMNKKNIKVDKDTCQTKWSSLLKTYNKCKAKLIFPTNFPFYQMMEQVLGQPKSPKKIEKTTDEELNAKKIGLLNVENDSNVCNKKLIIDSKINDTKSPRVLLLSSPINEQTKLSSLSSTVQINNNTNNTNNTNTRRISQGSQNFTLEDVERVVQNALDTKLQRIVNAFQSTIDSLKSMSNSLNIKVTNNEETVTQIKNKVQNLENEFKSATVKLVKDNNNTDKTKTMQTVMLNNQQGTPEQLNNKKKLFIISRPKAIIDSSGKKKVYQQVQDVQSIEGNLSTSKLKKICRLQSTPGKSTETSIDNVNNKNKTSTTPTTPTSTQRQMTVIGQFLKLSKFPTAQSTPIGNVIKISDPASARNSTSSIINKVE